MAKKNKISSREHELKKSKLRCHLLLQGCQSSTFRDRTKYTRKEKHKKPLF